MRWSRMLVVRMFVVAATMTLAAATVIGCSSSSDDNGGSKKSDSGGVTASTTVAGTPVAVTLTDTDGLDAPQTMVVTPDSVAAGAVTFTVDNQGTIQHEFLVLKTDTPYDQLEVTDGKVSEADAVGEIHGSGGEIHGFPAGETRSTTMELEAGSYVLVCNIQGHYELEMRAPFTVA